MLCKAYIYHACTLILLRSDQIDLNTMLHSAREWHSNIFCTAIFVLSQDESQGTTTEIVGSQSQIALWLGKSQPCILCSTS